MAVGKGETTGTIVVTGREVDDASLAHGVRMLDLHRKGCVVDATRVLIHQNPCHGWTWVDEIGFLVEGSVGGARQPSAMIKGLTHGIAADPRQGFTSNFDHRFVGWALEDGVTSAGVIPKRTRFNVQGSIPIGTVTPIVVESAVDPFGATVVEIE